MAAKKKAVAAGNIEARLAALRVALVVELHPPVRRDGDGVMRLRRQVGRRGLGGVERENKRGGAHTAKA